MKDYQKPEFELISLIAQEEITSDFPDASFGIGDADEEGW